MKLTKLTWLVWVAALCFMVVEPGLACTCMAPATAAEAFGKSSAVFRGKVVKIYRPFLDTVGITRTANYRVKFAITKRWKGTRSKTIVVTTRLSGEACGFPFEGEKEYLVYVVPEPAEIQTGICTGTRNLAGAELEMEQLDQLLAKASRQRR